MKIAFVASETPLAEEALELLQQRYGSTTVEKADCVVALGGDGLVIKTLHRMLAYGKPVFPLRRTSSVGFLCNNYREEKLLERLERAQEVQLHPLKVTTTSTKGEEKTALALNEIVLIRESPQAARLHIKVNGIERIERYSGDGLLISTPAGSTAYNHSSGGPIMPIDANTLVMTAISGFRPRGWSYAILPQTALVEISALEIDKRPIRVETELENIREVLHARIELEPTVSFRLLFDPEEHLSERIIREQFLV